MAPKLTAYNPATGEATFQPETGRPYRQRITGETAERLMDEAAAELAGPVQLEGDGATVDDVLSVLRNESGRPWSLDSLPSSPMPASPFPRRDS